MTFVPVSRGPVLALALLLSVSARSAVAQTRDGAAAPGASRAKPAATGPLRVAIEAPSDAIDVPRLQQSLARELGREVVIVTDGGAVDVRVRANEARAEVRYTTPAGEQLMRDVALPPDRERSLQVLSWLTVNLVRDEASELLEELRARRQAEAEARAAEDKAAVDKAAADKATADKAAADKATADKAAADKAAAEAARARARKPAKSPLLRDPLKSFDVALATPISLLPDSAKRELYLQLALGYGDSGAIRGIAVSPSLLRIRQDVLGLATATGFLWIGGDTRGAVASAGYARVEGKLDGASAAGGMASARALNGVAVAGGMTLLRDASSGILIAGGANVGGDLRGIQIAGGLNFARDLRGIQIAGGVNAARDFSGMAIASVNVQRRMRGIQIGIINVADEVDGLAIGLITLARNGRVQPVVWGANDKAAHLALKSIAGYTFTQLGAGIELNGATLSYDAGIGAHLRLPHGFFLEPGVHYSVTRNTSDDPDLEQPQIEEHQVHYIAGAGLRLGEKLDLLVGAGIKHTVSDTGSGNPQPEVRAGIAFF